MSKIKDYLLWIEEPKIKIEKINQFNLIKRIVRIILSLFFPNYFPSQKYRTFYFTIPEIPKGNIEYFLRWKGNKLLPKIVYINGFRARLLPTSELGLYKIKCKQIWQWENIFSIPIDKITGELNFILASKKVCRRDSFVADNFINIKKKYTNISTSSFEALKFLQRCKNKDKNSPFMGLYFGCYDLDIKSFRLQSWVWTSAAVIWSLLLYSQKNNSPFFYESVQAGLRLIDFQEKEGKNRGAFMCRWDTTCDHPTGFTKWLAPNDSAFIGAYALLPLYRYTNDKRFLNASLILADWIIKKGMKANGQLKVGFRKEKKKLFYNMWFSYGRRGRLIFSRGQAWAMDGLISSYLLLNEEYLLELCEECAKTMINFQTKEGGWYYLADCPETGFCNKGTPILAYHLIRLSKLTGNIIYREAAERAVAWCEKNQYHNNDSWAKGGIVSWNTEGCIINNPNTRTAFPYATAYYLATKYFLEKKEVLYG